MEMRTGKTITAFEACRIYGAISVLFLTKKKAVGSIIKDSLLFPSLNVTVTNYEQIANLANTDLFDIIIIDEAHSKIAGYPKPSKTAILLKEKIANKKIIYLSGSPSPESWSQLFHQFWISSFSPFPEKTFYKWAAIYVDKKTKLINGFNINDYSHAKIDKIKEKIDHLFIHYTQSEAGFEIKVTDVLIPIQMNQRTDELIRQLTKKRIIELENGNIIADTPAKLMCKIHQLSAGTIIYDNGRINIIDTTKIDYINFYYKEKKIAIFYKYIAEREMITRNLQRRITENYFEFNSTDENTVFIGQLSSIKEGVNLSKADLLVYFNIDFSAVTYLQSRERHAHKDRNSEAIAVFLFSKGGIEEMIYNRLRKKKNFTAKHFEKQWILKAT